ncbi:glycosyltransferase family 2 protein [Bradyrhizobium sp. STM 3562]|uniref:glycosyltransferase family 2 protein n=1 Tax=Bradyrhizobium sp. STM 3562 TaxID=578924 RepID=UPI00388DD21D
MAILLAVKDGERFLADQLRSFANQTHQNWSLNVSDDGSADGTVDIVRQFADQISNTVTLRPGPQRGFCKNFMSLVREDTIAGDYFAFSDQDDIWYADKMERAIRLLRTVPDGCAGLYCSRTELVGSDARHRGYSPRFTKRPSFQNALVQSIAGGNTMVFNKRARELLKKTGDTDALLHDWLAYQVVAATGGVIFYDSSPSLKYRQHSDNLVGSNLGLRARIKRVKMLTQGQWEQWNDFNLRALEALGAEITGENRKILENFSKMRLAKWLPQRLWYFIQSGVYRQTLMGNISLLVAVAAGKM